MSGTANTLLNSSNSAEVILRGPVEADLLFYQPPSDDSIPYNYVESSPPGETKRNFQEIPHTVHLTDIRTENVKSFTLDKDAFQVCQNISTSTAYGTFGSDEEIKRLYYPEVEKLLLAEVPGARRVIIFDHTIRRQDPAAHRQPLYRAHVDQSAKAAANCVQTHVPNKEEAASILTGACRYRIVNVWRPINGTVQSNPLAFAAVSTVNMERDLVHVEFRHPHRTGEVMLMRPHPDHKWMYLSGVKDSERLLLKCFDSEGGGATTASKLPHTAFWDPRTPEGAKIRESIEVRTLVFG